MAIDAGRLRHDIRIEYFDYARDSDGEVIQNPDTGEVIEEWIELYRVYGAVEPIRAREFISSQALQSEITANITIRFIDNLKHDMRIRHVRGGSLSDIVYEPKGFIHDTESGIEYIIIPVKRIELP